MGIVGRWLKYLGGFDPITVEYLGGMTTKPTYAHQVLINDFVKTTKSIIQNKADVMYLGNINDSNDSFRNIVKNAHHGTKEGTGLVWDAYWGYTNPIGTGYVDTHYNPSTEGDKYKLDDAAVGTYLFGTNSTNILGIAVSTFESVSIKTVLGTAGGYGYMYNGINDTSLATITPVPFISGFHINLRTASNNKYNYNQNISPTISTQVSASKPNVNFQLFKYGSGTANWNYGLNFVYIGAALTDAECIVLNNAYNDYLIQCLFLKYGADNFGVKMAKSYFLELHNFEKYEAWEVYEFIKRHQSDYVDSAGTGYLYNTFGPSGQNKTVTDYIMLFKAGGNLAANAWTKSGATLRWNQDGTVTASNTMPAYTRGTKLGIVTVTSMDGWNGVTLINRSQTPNNVNSFYGNFPMVEKIKIGNYAFYSPSNRTKINLINNSLINGYISLSDTSFPGSAYVNINNFIGKVFTNYVYLFNMKGDVIGDMTLLSSEFCLPSNRELFIYGTGLVYSLYGSLNNILLDYGCVAITIINTNITSGFGTWNKNFGACNISNNKFPINSVDAQYSVIDNYFVGAVIPIKSLTLSMQGASMGIPTGGNNNVNRLSIIAKHVAAGWVATLNNNT